MESDRSVSSLSCNCHVTSGKLQFPLLSSNRLYNTHLGGSEKLQSSVKLENEPPKRWHLHHYPGQERKVSSGVTDQVEPGVGRGPAWPQGMNTTANQGHTGWPGGDPAFTGSGEVTVSSDEASEQPDVQFPLPQERLYNLGLCASLSWRGQVLGPDTPATPEVRTGESFLACFLGETPAAAYRPPSCLPSTCLTLCWNIAVTSLRCSQSRRGGPGTVP